MKLSTGREWEVGGAGNEIVGIGADLEVTVGYDHGNDEWDGDEHMAQYITPLTDDEKMEVCDLMIARWLQLKHKIAKKSGAAGA